MVVRQAVDSIPRFVVLYHQFKDSEAQGPLFADFFVTLLVFGFIVIGPEPGQRRLFIPHATDCRGSVTAH